MKRRITRLTVLQTGKLLAVMYSFISLFMLPIMLIAMLCAGAKAIAPMLAMLVVYPIVGFIGGVILSALYNLACKWVGGLEVTVEAVEGE